MTDSQRDPLLEQLQELPDPPLPKPVDARIRNRATALFAPAPAKSRPVLHASNNLRQSARYWLVAQTFTCSTKE